MKKGSHDQSGSLRGGVIFVLVKAIVFTIAFLFVSVFVFGMRRCPDDSMSPSFQGGDLVLFNRRDREYRKIYEKTFPSKKGISFPVRVKRGKVFVLADERQNSVDSRIYGVVNERDIKGTVVSVFRVRGF